MNINQIIQICIVFVVWSGTLRTGFAEERRAPPPDFSEGQVNKVFFSSLDEALGGTAPDLASLRKTMNAASAAKTEPPKTPIANGDQTWERLVSATTIEDEIKRLRLHYDSLVSSPGVFRKENDAIQMDLTVLAALFAVVTEYSAEVRWKKDAAVARDLMARTAVNARTASPQVFNEAKTRKADLQDLVSGTGLSGRKADAQNDWSKIASHGQLMSYSEQLINKLEQDTRTVGSTQSQLSEIKHRAELLAVLGMIFTQDGMDYAGDEEYDQFSQKLSEIATQTVSAISSEDLEAVQKRVGLIRTKCDACHAVYR